MDIQPEDSPEPLIVASELSLDPHFERLTHYLFRYPAKFHPPVVRALLETFTTPGQLVLDPFCGSGTVGVEAAALGRHSVLVDVDPLAVAVSKAKTRRYEPRRLRASIATLRESFFNIRRDPPEYESMMFADIAESEYEALAIELAAFIPAIPNLRHWFRRYVIIDLARMLREISTAGLSNSQRLFIDVVFASVIRNVSQADPVPVSGLEVTKWMREREAKGRLVDPFATFDIALRKALAASDAFFGATKTGIRTRARVGDATDLGKSVPEMVDAVLTSPPYHGAVDYYRRHQLEMFWLGLTRSQSERLALLQRYVGRPHVPPRHPWATEVPPTALAKEWSERMSAVSVSRGSEFRHYITAMHRFFGSLSTRVRTNGVALLVVGHSTWNKAEIPTTALFRELAGDSFSLEQVLTYPVKNRYMSYDRRNSASIDREYVLVMRRTTAMTQGPSRKVLVRRGGGVRPVSDATRRSNSS